MRLRNHIKQHRARVELTQQELARRVGVRRQTILSIEKGRYVPSTVLAFDIARVLDMPVDELFELDEERE
jgi:putative transcriptional regulator